MGWGGRGGVWLRRAFLGGGGVFVVGADERVVLWLQGGGLLMVLSSFCCM